MSFSAIYSIVDTAVMSAGTSHITGDLTTAHDHVLLLGRDDIPCAVATERWNDLDVHYEFLDGDLGQIQEEMQHEIRVKCVGLNNEAHRKLDYLARSRRKVQFTPGFGPRTEFAYRPLRWLKSTERDLTGKHIITLTNDTGGGFVWDDLNGAGNPLANPSASKVPRLVRTPHGAGQLFEGSLSNLANPFAPQYPVGYGWSYSGTGVTRSVVSGGFGAESAPDSVKFVGDGATSSRAISKTITLSSASDSVVDVVVFLKGCVTTSSPMSAYGNIATQETVQLQDLDLSSWTPVRFRVHTSGTTTFTIVIILGAPPTGDGAFNLEIGPCGVYQTVSASHLGQRVSEIYPPSYTKVQEKIDTTTNVEWPGEGTCFAAFYVPEWFDPTETFFCGVGHCPSAVHAGKMQLFNYDSTASPRGSFYTSDSNSVAANLDIIPGRVNTMCSTWCRGEASLYYDGALVNSTNTVGVDFYSAPMRLGAAGSTSPLSPFFLHQFRIDGGQWSAERVSNEHFTAVHPAASHPIVSARGRKYYIEKIPGTPLIAQDGTYWSGDIILRQSDYSRPMSDICTCEGDYR